MYEPIRQQHDEYEARWMANYLHPYASIFARRGSPEGFENDFVGWARGSAGPIDDGATLECRGLEIK